VPNVSVSKTATTDCSAPAITNVHVVPGNSKATITWDTSEAANGIVHYGTSLPTSSSFMTTGASSTHTATLMNLAECATYYFWLESADAAGNLTASNSGGGAFAFTTLQGHQLSMTSTDTPVPIPDASTAGATSTIAVSDAPLVSDVNLTVNLTHPYDGDLTLSLITPATASITLAAQRGGSGDDFRNTVFDDEATSSIVAASAPYTGSFRPEGSLSAADGVSGAGSWKLKVVDSGEDDVGTIDNWTLNLGYPSSTCVPAGAPPPVPDGSFGTGTRASRFTGAVSGVHLTWDAASCAAKNYHLLYGGLQNVSSLAPDSGVCGLGPLGAYDWMDAPAGSLWFLVVGDDAAAREGSWGTNGAGAHRRGQTPSGFCGFTTRSNAGTCP
jgi:subtilisin-like proprotein convertase family protein